MEVAEITYGAKRSSQRYQSAFAQTRLTASIRVTYGCFKMSGSNEGLDLIVENY